MAQSQHGSDPLDTRFSPDLVGIYRQPKPSTEWRYIFPHVNDALLLISAISAAVLLGQYPFVDAWLTAKVLGLIAYILLGAVALTYGPTYGIRISAYAGAILSFTYVVHVAFTKTPSIL